MIKHIVLFKLRDDVGADVKASRLPSIRSQFLSLMGVILSLRGIEIGLNVNPKEKFDLALVATFDDLAGLAAYARGKAGWRDAGREGLHRLRDLTPRPGAMSHIRKTTI